MFNILRSIGSRNIAASESSQHEPHRCSLDALQKSCLHCWISNLHLARPRAVFLPGEHRNLVISYSDGEGGDVGVGIVAWCPDRFCPVPIAGLSLAPEIVRCLWSMQRGS